MFLDFKYSVCTIRQQIPISKITHFLCLSTASTSYQLIITLYLYYYKYGCQKVTQCMLFTLNKTTWKARANVFPDIILMYVFIEMALGQSAVSIILRTSFFPPSPTVSSFINYDFHKPPWYFRQDMGRQSLTVYNNFHTPFFNGLPKSESHYKNPMKSSFDALNR